MIHTFLAGPEYCRLINQTTYALVIETSMRAFVISEYAHPSKIQLTYDAQEPILAPGSDELLIDVHSAGLNFFDVRLLS